MKQTYLLNEASHFSFDSVFFSLSLLLFNFVLIKFLRCEIALEGRYCVMFL